MGFLLEVDGRDIPLAGFSVSEASTPLAAGDSSGQVGTISLQVKKADLDAFPLATKQPYHRFGPQLLAGKSVRLTDSRKGYTVGTVTSVSDPRNGIYTLSCESRLGLLNVYGVQAGPFQGTLSGAFEYYLQLANVTSGLLVDPDIALDPVVFPGWEGELWFNLKQMAAAIDADISLVSGVILMRPIRKRVATTGRDVSRSLELSGQTAQFVEVYQYNNRPITNKLVYPPGGWSEDVSVINVNAGEYVEEVIELSASVSSIQQPVMQTFVSREHDTSSVFTVVGDDGLPIIPAQWAAAGGSLSVDINPNTTSLTVKIQAPISRITNKDGEAVGVYSISLSSDSSTGRYSTLRIVGSGVSFDKQLHRIATGVSAAETGTEVGVTIDNPFLSTTGQVFRAGGRAAKMYAGKTLSISGVVTAVNRLGDSGASEYPTYAEVQAQVSPRTYAQDKAFHAGLTYAGVQDYYFDQVRNNFENQVFGNVNGARIWDAPTRRYYRIREATLNPDTISFSADDDFTYEDDYQNMQPRTYAMVQTLRGGMTYGEARLAGMIGG